MTRMFWTGIATGLVIGITAFVMALTSDTVRCRSFGPNVEVVVCAVGHIHIPRMAS